MKRFGQKGFGAAEAMVIIFIVAVLAGLGWFVWSKQKDKNNSSKNTDSSESATGSGKKDKKSANSLPDGYVRYTDSKYDFSFAYPETWGKLSATGDAAQEGLDVITPPIDNLPVEDAQIQGRFGYAVGIKRGFKVAVEKYGPIVEYGVVDKLPVWRVVEQAEGSGYAVDDVYPAKSTTNTNGITVYEFHWTDEGATHARWVVELDNRFVTITLPAIMRPDMAQVSQSELSAYYEIANNIRNSFKLGQ